MMYFNGINNLEQAKLHYRKLAKQLHPDKGGTAGEFQRMQEEYKIVVERFQHSDNAFNIGQSNQKDNQKYCSQVLSPEKELLNNLGKLAKILIKKQVPQNYLRQKMKTTDSALKNDIFSELVSILDEL